jgi:hypothetical protein
VATSTGDAAAAAMCVYVVCVGCACVCGVWGVCMCVCGVSGVSMCVGVCMCVVCICVCGVPMCVGVCMWVMRVVCLCVWECVCVCVVCICVCGVSMCVGVCMCVCVCGVEGRYVTKALLQSIHIPEFPLPSIVDSTDSTVLLLRMARYKNTNKFPVTYSLPCGGGVEYLHRSPASRSKRRKGKSRI